MSTPTLRPLTSLLLLCLLAAAAAAQSATDGKTPAGFAPGAPAGTYPLSGFDTVNFFNGNLNFSLPLLKVGGRSGSGASIQLRLERKWRSIKGGGNIYYATAGDWNGSSPGFGAGALNARIVGHPSPCEQGGGEFNTLTRFTFIAPDGTEYELRDVAAAGSDGWTVYDGNCSIIDTPNRGRVFVTSDGSAATYVSDIEVTDSNGAGGSNGYLMLKDGTRFRIESKKVVWARDRNGNRTTYTYTGTQLTQITDSLGRTVTITYLSGQTQITYSGFGGAARTIKINRTPLQNALRSGYSLQTYRQLFPELLGTSTTTQYNDQVVASVQLPDYDPVSRPHRQYTFQYNSYGELARVVLPTGGAIEYDWAAGLMNGNASGVVYGSSSSLPIYRRVVERRVYPGGGTGAGYASRMTVSRPEDATQPNLGYTTVEQRDPAGTLLTKELHYYHGSARSSFYGDPLVYSGYKEGKEWKTEVFDANGTTLLRRIQHTWQQPAGDALWPLVTAETNDNARPNNPQVTQTVTTLADANLVSKQTFKYDRYGNQTDSYEYDFGTGAPPTYATRHSQTTYVTTNPVNGQDYASPTPTSASIHLRGLPQHQRVYSVNPSTGAETQVAHTETLYDETALAWYGAVTGWADPGSYRGNATRVRRWRDLPAPAVYVETRAEYDQVGNVTKSVDARNNVSLIQFSSAYAYALPTQVSSPVPDPAGTYGSTTALVTTTAYDFSSGLVTSTTDANNMPTTVEYNDLLDRPTQVNRPDTGRTSYEYGRNQYGDYLRTQTKLNTAGTLTDAYVWFDGLGRAARSFSYDPQEASAAWLTSDTEYDPLGRAWRTSVPYRTAGAASAVNPSGRWAETTFDALGRVVRSKTTADNASVVTAYSGQYVTVTDQAGKVRRSKTDALGRLVRVDEPDASGSLDDASGQPVQPTHYTYDALGNLRKVEQGAHLRFFMYDSLGRLMRAKNPEQLANAGLALTDPVTGNGQWSLAYAYDAAGNLTSRTDARNVTTAYWYDNLNRNTLVDYSDTSAYQEVRRHYDGAVNGRGRFWADYHYRENWTKTEHAAVDGYDPVGRPVNRRQHFYENTSWGWGPGYNVQYEYDLAGNVTKMTYPSGRAVSYAYDSAGRPSGFTGNLGDGAPRTYSAGVRYSAFGGVEQEQFGTQTPLYLKKHYNVRGQLFDTRLSTASLQANEWDWNRGAIVNYYSANYEWGGTPGSTGSGPDNNGNLHRSQHWVPGDDSISTFAYTQQTYAYDSLNRLKSFNELPATHAGQGAQSFAQTYDYDRWGNRTINPAGTWGGVNATQFSVDQATNRLGVPAGSPSQMVYDAAGHLTYDTYTGQGTRAFDAEGRMTSAQDSAGRTSIYSYDADGRRARRVTGGESMWQVSGLGGELLAEYAAGAPPSNVTKEYGYRAGELLITAAAPDDAPKITPAAATASNTHSSPWAAANVLDGNAGTSWSSGQFPAQWVQLDLGQSYNLTKVRMLVDQYPAGRTVHEVWGGATPGGMSLLGFIDSTTQDQQWLQLTSPAASVRYLKVQTTASPSWVGWREVEAYGSPSASGPTANLALGRPATQSSDGWGGVASRAVDGNRDGAWGANSVTHTAGGSQDWWHVDLGSVQAIGEIRVWNRTDCCAERLTNFYVLVSDTPFASADLSATLNQAGVSAYYTPGQGGRPTSVGVGRTGRYVRVQLAGAGVLSLAEVEVVRAGATDLRWLVSDHLGTPRMTVDLSGSLSGVRRHDYLPFGEDMTVGGRTPQQGYAADSVRQKFTGYERDNETGLDFAQARYYSPTQGRFISVDPLDPVLGRQGASDTDEANKQFVSYLSQPQRWNRYAYCLNNPLRHVDPDGLAPITVNLNIIFDKSSNYSAEEKLAFANTYVAQAQKDFGNIEVVFNVTYTEGSATNISENNHAITSGAAEGAINAFVTRGSVGPAPEVTSYSTGAVWISTGRSIDSQSSGNLTHGIIHALGIFPGVNGYDRVDHSGTRHDIIRREIWNALTGNSAESATQSLQAYLGQVSAGPLQNGGKYPSGVSLNHSRYRKEIDILRQGAQKYLGRPQNRPR